MFALQNIGETFFSLFAISLFAMSNTAHCRISTTGMVNLRHVDQMLSA